MSRIRKTAILAIGLVISLFYMSESATYYISPTGNDGNNGLSEGTPWATFSKSFQVLQPGDTLILLDGTYYQSMSLSVNGTPGNPITFKAKNDGKAIIDGQYTRVPFVNGWQSGGGSYIVVEGIVAKNSSGAVYALYGKNATFRRCSGSNANTDENTHVWTVYTGGGVSDPSNMLIEDCIGHGSGRKMFMYYASYVNVVFRRCFSAWLEWQGHGPNYVPCCWPWGENIEIYNWDQPDVPVNGLVENCIAYCMSVNSGFSLGPNPALTQDNKFLGCMSIKIGMRWDGTPMTWQCPPLPNPEIPQCSDIGGWNMRMGYSFRMYASGSSIVKDNLFQDVFAWGCAGPAMRTIDGSPWQAGSTNNRLIRATFKNCGIGNPVPQMGANVEMSQADLNQFSEVTDCYIEDVSGGASHNGGGAIIVNRYVDGVLTTEPLWPWPMEDRVQQELGISVTSEMTNLLGIDISGDPVKLKLTATSQTLPADNTSTSEILARVCDENDVQVLSSNASITFTLSGNAGGTLLGTNPVNASGGLAKITYQSSTSEGTATITATSTGLTQDSVSLTVFTNHAPNQPSNPLCNGLIDPQGITDYTPELSWTFSDPDTGDDQSAYRILVANSQSALDSDNGNMWDTNKIPSTQKSVTYKGLGLQQSGVYYWKVMTWDNYDQPSVYSQTGTFSMSDTVFVLVGGTSWQGMQFSQQTGQFTIQFDMKPLNDNMDGVVGLSNGAAGAYTALATILRLGSNGLMDVRNGGSYGADASVSYTADTEYHVQMDVDVNAKTYDVTVTPSGLSPVTIASGYAFRSDQSAVSALDYINVVAAIGSHEVYNIMLGTSTPPPPQPAITVSMPNGGETWQVTTQHAITWTSQGNVGNINISLSTDGGTNWSTLVSATANDGTETITVPDSQSTTCRVRVCAISGSPSDMSNSNFTIAAPPQAQITVSIPNGGETWQANSQKTVTWTSQGSVGNAVGIDLSTDGGSNWTSVVSGTSNDGTENITVPNSPSTTCRIRVTDVSGSPSDVSNGNFTINAGPGQPTISVTPAALDFGEVEIGSTGTMDLTITNTGGGTLSGSITSDKKWIQVSPTSFEGNTTSINVTVDNNILNQLEGEYTGTISVISNGGNQDITVTLTATCVLVKPNPYDPSKGNLIFFGDGIVPNDTKIVIYTLGGKLVAELTENEGKKKIKWDGKNENGEEITSGVYIYVYESPQEKGVGKFTIISK